MKKILVSILTLFFIVSMIANVYAASGSISLTASADTVSKGKTFTVTVSGTADNNITGLQAKISYDTNKLSIESKSAGTGFSDVSGSGEIAIASTGSENLSKTGTLYTITFKVLDTATEGDTTISVTNAVLALVNEELTQEDTGESEDKVTIKIKDEIANGNGTTGEENPSTGANNPSNNSNSNGDNSSSASNSNSNNTTTSTKKLPYTGVGSVAIAIIVLGAVSIISYISYKKYKNI